jgi:hypothetical protein
MPNDPDQALDRALAEVWELLTPRQRRLIANIARALAGEDVAPDTIPLSRATALAGEQPLARLWDTPAEDAAWQHL